MTPLILDDEVRNQIRALRTLAEANPVDVEGLVERLKIPENKQRHMQQMTRQTIPVPLAFMVTFSIEHGHPCGECRHMSMSVERAGRVPSPEAVWMVAQEFGFYDSLILCSVWKEKLLGHGVAINIVQPITPNNP